MDTLDSLMKAVEKHNFRLLMAPDEAVDLYMKNNNQMKIYSHVIEKHVEYTDPENSFTDTSTKLTEKNVVFIANHYTDLETFVLGKCPLEIVS